jgi:hypothetical protein
MKKLYILTIGMVLVGLLAVPAVFAKGKKNKTPATQTVTSDVFAQYDKNSNGILDADEKDAIRKDLPQDPNGILKAFDMNSDGKLSDDEIASIPATKTVDAPAKEKHKKKKK